MTERPILFSAPMVRALLAGTKTQTRRLVKWRGVDPGLNLEFTGLRAFGYAQGWVLESPTRTSSAWRCKPTPCPYGKPGDSLWVREAWRGSATLDWAKPSDMPAGSATFYEADDRSTWCDDLTHPPSTLKRPGMFMPRWASRITLEVTGVRVERLQDISEADAIAEGVNRFPGCCQDDDAAAFNRIGPVDNDSFPIARYAVLWESIKGPGSWDANPWVWVVEFKRLE